MSVCVTVMTFRQLVTRSDIKIQSLVIEILKLVIEAMRENSNKLAQAQESSPATDDEGKSASSDDLVAGKSIVISILEVIFCLLIQKVPTLNSSISGFHSTPTGTNDENDELIAETVKCLEMLPDICSDSGNPNVCSSHSHLY